MERRAARLVKWSDLDHMPPPDNSPQNEPPIGMTSPPFDADIRPHGVGTTEEMATGMADSTASAESYNEPASPAPGMLAENAGEDAASHSTAASAEPERADSQAEEPQTGEDQARIGPVSEQPAPDVQAQMFNGGPAGAADSAAESSAPYGENGRRQLLRITFSRSGQFSRDKYRLREIFDAVRDPRGRDQFVVVVETNGSRHQLTFPNRILQRQRPPSSKTCAITSK